MRFELKHPPRAFTVGVKNDITVQDTGAVHLGPNEQLTFVTPNGCQYDVAAKDWGFYATPSVNHRLRNEGFKTALVESEVGRIFVMIVEAQRMDLFETYCRAERQTVLRWLDEMPEKSR